MWHPVEGIATSPTEEVTGRLQGLKAASGNGPAMTTIANGEIIVVFTSTESSDPRINWAVRKTNGQWDTGTVVNATGIQDDAAVAFGAGKIHVAYRSDEEGCALCNPLFLQNNDPASLSTQEVFYEWKLNAPTKVVVSDTPMNAGGEDPARCELYVSGTLRCRFSQRSWIP